MGEVIRKRKIASFILKLVCLWLGLEGSLQAQKAEVMPSLSVVNGGGSLRRVHGIVSRQMLSPVNGSDALASIRAWFNLLGKENGLQIETKVDVGENVEKVRQRLESGSVDLLILDIVDFLQLEKLKLVRAAMAGEAAEGNGPLYSYLLLTRASASGVTIAELRGKRAIAFSRVGGSSARMWLDVVLSRQGLGRADRYFSTMQDSTKAQSCVLPLFFGAVEACIVDEVSFNLLREMNPQLGRLQVVARSKPVLDVVIASPVPDRPFRQELEELLLSLDKSERGRQLLTVFGASKVRRFKANELDAIREVWRDFNLALAKQEQN